MNLLNRLELLKYDLRRTQGFKLRHCFKAIDDFKKGFICQDQMTKFMHEVCVELCLPPITREDVRNVMRRIDLNGNRKLSFAEFCEALNPIKIPVE